ncbi:MAG: EF-P beta-lysylation protein EpmB [Gammaproteobacteria bacterium]|nr:EF-P beta-lysylation protein EpmB [Gammaproteobacteria bacterium]
MTQIIAKNIIIEQTSWQKELAQGFNDPEKLLTYLGINPEKFKNSFAARKLFPLRVPLPFVNRMAHGDAQDPLLLQVMTDQQEFDQVEGYTSDPLSEQTTVLPGLLHKYDNRVLLMVRTGCAINCRYCFRRHFPYQDNSPNKSGFKDVAQYIAQRPQINEIILSGGDPLMANDNQLAALFELLSPIKHLTRIRFHTRLPVVIPSRITEQFSAMCQQSRFNIVMVLHINHGNEIDQSVMAMTNRLKQAGVTLLNQAVLLKGINDTSQSQIDLSEQLFNAGVMPYYLHLLDKVAGASHFDSDETNAIAMMKELYQTLPGFLVPKLVREIGGEAHKTPIDLGLAPKV